MPCHVMLLPRGCFLRQHRSQQVTHTLVVELGTAENGPIGMKNKLMCYPQQLGRSWKVFGYPPRNSGTSSTICPGTFLNLISFQHRNLPEPHQPSAPEPFRTSSCTRTLRNLIRHLHRKAPEPSGTLRNLVLQLLRIAPELFWAKDPIASFAVGEKVFSCLWLEIYKELSCSNMFQSPERGLLCFTKTPIGYIKTGGSPPRRRRQCTRCPPEKAPKWQDPIDQGLKLNTPTGSSCRKAAKMASKVRGISPEPVVTSDVGCPDDHKRCVAKCTRLHIESVIKWPLVPESMSTNELFQAEDTKDVGPVEYATLTTSHIFQAG